MYVYYSYSIKHISHCPQLEVMLSSDRAYN